MFLQSSQASGSKTNRAYRRVLANKGAAGVAPQGRAKTKPLQTPIFFRTPVCAAGSLGRISTVGRPKRAVSGQWRPFSPLLVLRLEGASGSAKTSGRTGERGLGCAGDRPAVVRVGRASLPSRVWSGAVRPRGPGGPSPSKPRAIPHRARGRPRSRAVPAAL